MTVPPIDPSVVSGLSGEWQVTPPAAPGEVGGTGSGESFGDLLVKQVDNLSGLQDRAAVASQSLADGTATDVSSVVMAVEKAQLAMQLAGQIRTRATEAVNDIFHTQI
jgi:flagellar hook-basal body complex protein FliE